MYTQSLDPADNVTTPDTADAPPEQARFDAVIAADGKIEPQDWSRKPIARHSCVRSRNTHIPK